MTEMRTGAVARFLRTTILFLLIFCLSGCSQGAAEPENDAAKKKNTNEFEIFYTNEEKNSLVSRTLKPKSQSFDGILKELQEAFVHPIAEGVYSCIPDGVSMKDCVMGVDNLTVDFSPEYLSLSNVQEILLRAGLVKTLIQLPGVYHVSVTVEGQPLVEDTGTQVGPMNEDTFVDTGGAGINSYHSAVLNLYFSDSTGKMISREMRNVYYSSNLITEKVIVEQIISGPADKDLLPVTDPSVKVLGVRITDNACIINLDSAFNKTYNETVEPETALYAFVNAICEACDVTGVRFQIEGKNDIRFRGQVNLDQTFTRNADVVNAPDENIEEPVTDVILEEDTGHAGVGVDPALIEDNTE